MHSRTARPSSCTGTGRRWRSPRLPRLRSLPVLIGTFTQARRATRQAALAEIQRQRADQEARTASAQRDFALRQLSRAEAISDLNAFLLSDTAPSAKPFTASELLGRAEHVVERQPQTDENHIEMLISLGRQYSALGEDAKAENLLSKAYDLSRAVADPGTRATSGMRPRDTHGQSRRGQPRRAAGAGRARGVAERAAVHPARGVLLSARRRGLDVEG